MQTQASQQYNQPVRIAGIAMVMYCAVVVATLLTWAPSSIGSVNDDAAPAKLSAMPAQGAGTKEAPADPAHESSDSSTRPTCAELGEIALTQETERTGKSGGSVGCGVGGNLAGGTSAGSNRIEEQVDGGTLLAWYPVRFQTTTSGMSQSQMKADRS